MSLPVEESFLEAAAQRWAPRPIFRYAAILAMDAAVSLIGLYGAIALWYGAEAPTRFARLSTTVTLLVFLRVVTAWFSRLHRWSFTRSGLSEGARLVQAMFATSVVFAAGSDDLPLPVYVVEFFLTTSLMALYRFAPRVVDGWYSEWHKRANPAALRTIIVGAGSTGDLLARDLHRDAGKYYVVGFVDDDASMRGSSVSGKPVLGAISDLPRLVQQHRVTTVLLAIPSLPAQRIRQILALCASCKANFKTVPGSWSHFDKRISAAMLHDLSPDDLLPRDPISFDQAEIRRLVEGRVALVTGAAGSIGGEICRQLAHHGVSQLVMVDMNENELYLGVRRLQTECPGVQFFSEVADIREYERLRRLGGHYRPDLVFHAAAHKHVPLMEDAPEEAVKNNVFGTLNVALVAHEVGAEKLVVISTDKAVNPTSVMGASKRISELVVRDLARRSKTQMTAVRFGNVLGSAGSVVPLFKQQIERGGPVTVTHPECTRYFMTISEAVGLVLLAGLGGHGELCVLDMGEPIRIAEVAANLITLAGRIPGVEIPIVFTGLRPGEKLYEELLTEEEEDTAQVRNRINVATSPPPPPDLARRLHDLQELAQEGNREKLLDAIHRLVPTYRRTPAQPYVPTSTPLGVLQLVSRPAPSHAPVSAPSAGTPVPAPALGVAPTSEPRSSRRFPGIGWLQSMMTR